jgi:hypothetical protein
VGNELGPHEAQGRVAEVAGAEVLGASRREKKVRTSHTVRRRVTLKREKS